ncbi:hypothetical protein [Marinobacter sp. KMM 10035]|uniref:hypothetical protein n=1 Tax=Marinobacter sp. KMM 10035 TaxID=3134034 RepID=UPI00397C0E36
MTFDYILEIGHASLGPVVAILAVAVAYGQYRVQRQKAKSDLFALRFDVYRRTLRYVQAARYDSSIPPQISSEFAAALQEAQFLFDEQLWTSLTNIQEKGVAISVSLEMIRNTPPEQELSYRYTIQDSKRWMAQAEGQLAGLFNSYLRVR